MHRIQTIRVYCVCIDYVVFVERLMYLSCLQCILTSGISVTFEVNYTSGEADVLRQCVRPLSDLRLFNLKRVI